MTTVLSQKGQLVLPVSVREQLNLLPGDDLEIAIEDEDTITLRRVSHPANSGLVDLLLACPSRFLIPERSHARRPRGRGEHGGGASPASLLFSVLSLLPPSGTPAHQLWML